jgi:hypothetical protein
MNSFRSLAQVETANQAKRAAKLRRTQMDLSRYASRKFIKPEDLASGPQHKTIMAIEEGRYDKPVVTFEDGARLSLNGTNVSVLIDAFGSAEDQDWIGQRIELYPGTLRYNGNDNAAVMVRALNRVPAAARTPPKPQPRRDDPDDEIPFN